MKPELISEEIRHQGILDAGGLCKFVVRILICPCDKLKQTICWTEKIIQDVNV